MQRDAVIARTDALSFLPIVKKSNASFPRIDADALAVFLAVAEQGGVLAAARTIARSQPAVSERIRQLESSLGAALFLRTPRGMTLTAEGRALATHARRVRTALLDAENAFAQGHETGPQRLVLASSTTPAAFVIAPLLAEFAARHPRLGIELRVGNTDDVLAAVRDGTVPLGVIEGLPRASGVSLRPFCNDELLPVYSPENVSDNLRQMLVRARSARSLAGLPLLWREPGSGTRRVVEEAFRKAGVPVGKLSFDFVLGGTLALKAAALAGLGVAFLPRCAIPQELLLKQLTVVGPVRGLRIERKFLWALPAGGGSSLLSEFQSFAQRRMAARPGK